MQTSCVKTVYNSVQKDVKNLYKKIVEKYYSVNKNQFLNIPQKFLTSFSQLFYTGKIAILNLLNWSFPRFTHSSITTTK